MPENVKKEYDSLWHKFGWATHNDSYFLKFQKKWFLNRFNLDQDSFQKLIKNKNVIEIGTGSGAFLKNLKTAKKAIGIDISDTGINIASKIYENDKNIILIKEDLFKYDGRPLKLYDVVIADQMLHHTKNTFKALEKSVNLVKPNGIIMFYVYKKKTSLREFTDSFTRFFTTKMPKKWCMNFAKLTCKLGEVLSKKNLKLQRWIYWNIIKCFWNENFTYENNLRVNFDWYYPKIANRHTIKEVNSWIENLNLKTKSITIGRSGISIRARKCYP